MNPNSQNANDKAINSSLAPLIPREFLIDPFSKFYFNHFPIQNQKIPHHIKYVPESTPERIIFPFSFDCYNFLAGDYDDGMTDGRLTRVALLTNFNSFLYRNEEYQSYKNIWIYFKMIIIFLIIFFAIGIIVFIIGLTDLHKRHLFHDPLISSGTYIVIGDIIAGVFCLLMFKYSIKKTVKRIRNKLQIGIERFNEFMNEKNIKMMLSDDHFKWIELWLDYNYNPTLPDEFERPEFPDYEAQIQSQKSKGINYSTAYPHRSQ